ncbi:MAG: PAS domain S-box protein [Anaerolineae bacterium]|nr:PAS domain S-box protein [Anaerolineae bacterium]
MTEKNDVLVVDDDPALRDAIVRVLSTLGYAPVAAGTAREALDRISKDPPAVALIDLKLEEMSGLDLTRVVKERAWPTECIVLTDQASQGSAIEAVNLGAYGYVQKPYDADQLAMLVRGAFEKHRTEEMLRGRTSELGKRLQELNCLYGISELVQKPGLSLEEVLRRSVVLIPPAWQHSKVAGARITLDGQAFKTKNFEETPWRQASDILVYGKQSGTVEVCYLQEMPASDGGLFLRDERYLLDAIAGRLGRIVERKRVEQALEHSQEAMAHSHRLLLALNQASEAVQRARTPEQVYTTVLDEVTRLGYHAMVFTLTEDRTNLALSYVTVRSPLLRAAEKLAERSTEDFVSVGLGDFYEQIIAEGQAVFVESMYERLANDVPHLAHSLTQQVVEALEGEQGVYAPLIVGGETEGVLVVTGAGLTRDDVPAVNVFANQIAIALERGRLYQETRESAERLKRITASAHDAIIMVNAEERISFWNEAAGRMFGYSFPEVIDKDLLALLVPQRYHEAYRQHFSEFESTDEGLDAGKTFELVALRRDETEFPVEISLSAVRLGSMWNGIAIIRDISERKQAEEALRQYAADLEASNEELDAFAHTVAHDLKGPLNTTIGFAELILDSYSELPEDQLRDCLQFIVCGSGRMTNIVNALLLLASVRKIEDVSIEPLDMADIVTETRDRLSPLVAEHQAEIVTPDVWPTALGYAPWVEEVWANYVSNAIKYGGRPPRVELGAEMQGGDRVRFWVRDNGAGISSEEQARLFTPFTRLDQVQVKGHGLGLSIVRRIVERLGGQVAVESALGQGSVFSFTLPATPDSA